MTVVKPKEISLRNALEEIGKALFPEQWTGAEIELVYFDICHAYRDRLHEPEVQKFLQQDFNVARTLKQLQSDFRKQTFPKITKPKRKSKPMRDYTFLLPGTRSIIKWPQSLTSKAKTGTFMRFQTAWKTLVTALQNGDVLAQELKASGSKKDIGRTKWRSSSFEYDILRSEIYTQLTADPDDYEIFRCFVQLKTVQETIQNFKGEESSASERGRPGMKQLILQRLRNRGQNDTMELNLKTEATALREWVKELVPEIKTIENIIRAEHAKFAGSKKSTK